MKMSWRPEGWKNPHNNMMGKGTTCDICYEAGADAILEALRKESLSHTNNGQWCVELDVEPPFVSGDIVLIPDEEDTNG